MAYAPLIVILAWALARHVVHLWERHRLGQFGVILDPKNKLWLDELRLQVAENDDIMGRHVRASQLSWSPDRATAMRRLDAACEHLESVVLPNLGEMLTVLRDLARTASVIAAPKPLGLAAYRLWALRGSTTVVRFLGWLLIQGRDQVLLRIWFLRRALLVLVRTMTSTSVLAARHGKWYMTINDAVADLRTTQGEIVVTAEAVLLAFEGWQAQRATNESA